MGEKVKKRSRNSESADGGKKPDRKKSKGDNIVVQSLLNYKGVNFGLKLVDVNMRVILAPKFTQEIKAGVKEYLSGLLLKYSPELEGVIMTFSRIKVTSDYASITNESPFFKVPISAQFVIFKPQKKSRLLGVVQSVGAQYVGLLLYGLFNVSIDANEIPNVYEFDPTAYSWRHKSPDGKHIEMGSLIEFKVQDVVPSNDIISLKGSILDSDCCVL